MADDATQQKLLQLLDVLSVQVGRIEALAIENRADLGALRGEARSGFERVERRLGNLETRVEDIEVDLRTFHGEFNVFRDEFTRRVSALEH